MKRFLLVFLALAFIVSSASIAAAAPNVGNTTQKGSVLVFPRFAVSETSDTFFMLTNDYKTSVWVRCLYANGVAGPSNVPALQQTNDFMLELSAYKTVSFSAGLGSRFNATISPSEFDKGFMVCFATDSTGSNQINFNHLYGTAEVIDYGLPFTAAYKYNPWTFAARTGTLGTVIGTGGNIVLDGTSYDACPQYLNFNIGMSNEFFDTQITLLPCKQDITQVPAVTRTKAVFQIANENETYFSGAETCLSCWFEGFLSDISPNFLAETVGTCGGHFKVWGLGSAKCNLPGIPAVKTPFIGLAVDYYVSTQDSEVPVLFPQGASTGTGSGNNAGFILYDPWPGDIPERANK